MAKLQSMINLKKTTRAPVDFEDRGRTTFSDCWQLRLPRNI
jgi:hypothetical protein